MMVVPEINHKYYEEDWDECSNYGDPETTVIITTITWDGIIDMLFTMQCYLIYKIYAVLAVDHYRRLARCSLKGRRGGRQ